MREQESSVRKQAPEERPRKFESDGRNQRLSLVREFLLFVTENKKWWLIPIVLALGVVGLLVFFGSTGAAPFIYTLF